MTLEGQAGKLLSMNTNIHTTYENPLVSRYASEQMLGIFSPQFKFSTWRRLWLALAESQAELGLPIKKKQLAEMRKHLDDIDFDLAARLEKKFRHDVMAHIHTFAAVAPSAEPIIHLGATSAFVGDNTDLIQMRKGLEILRARLLQIINILAGFAHKYKKLSTPGYTHFQPAQLTTVGKRATLWCYDFICDIEEVQYRLENLKFRGVKGTIGTQASFLKLFDGDQALVRKLDKLVTEKMDFDQSLPVTGQTYSRKVDANILATLSGIAQSAHKISNDLRLLAHLKQIEEPFEKDQIGSSAMAYKRNPMRCERVASLARYVISLSSSPPMTAAAQWFERTLDDSANKRLTIPEAFLAVDSILLIMANVLGGLVVHREVIKAAVKEELPFIATEDILMAAVKAGGNRQKLHGLIRKHSMAAAEQIKVRGKKNDLLKRLQKERAFAQIDFNAILKPRLYTGRSAVQVDEFLRKDVRHVQRQFRKCAKVEDVELKV